MLCLFQQFFTKTCKFSTVGGITKENVSTLFQDHVSGYAKDADLSSMLIHIPEFEGPDEKAIENFIIDYY